MDYIPQGQVFVLASSIDVGIGERFPKGIPSVKWWRFAGDIDVFNRL
jgi:hypothetical protein